MITQSELLIDNIHSKNVVFIRKAVEAWDKQESLELDAYVVCILLKILRRWFCVCSFPDYVLAYSIKQWREMARRN